MKTSSTYKTSENPPAEQPRTPHIKRLANSFLFNVLGQGTPLLAALYAIPILISVLGVARFGILMLIWVVVGYFGLFDLGINRAIIKLVAERSGTENDGDIPGIFWTAMPLVILSSLLGSSILFFSSPWLVQSALQASVELQQEALPAFQLLAAAIPVVILIAGLTGFLEALHRFGMINLVRTPMGIFSFIGPLLVLPYSHNLYTLTAVLLIGRMIEFVALFSICLGVYPTLGNRIKFKAAMVRPLLSFGGWVTISNIISPFLTYLDRFVIGAMISVTAVAYYATPYSIVIKLLIIPSALVGVLFPTFAWLLLNNKQQAARMFSRNTKYVIFSTLPLLLIIFTFANEGLSLWVGKEFSANSFVVMQWLVIGTFLNGLAQLPVALIHGHGRPDLVAKLHLIELPFYLVVLMWLLEKYGIVGVAMAGVARITVDTLALYYFARHLIPEATFSTGQTFKLTLTTIIVFVLAANIEATNLKLLFCIIVLIIMGIWAWLSLDANEKNQITSFRLKSHDPKLK